MNILQTNSKDPHIRGWGCNAYSLLDLTPFDFTNDEADHYIHQAIKMGFILDNDIPIKKGNKWYRILVIDPQRFLEYVIIDKQRKYDVKEVVRITAPFNLLWPNPYVKLILEFQTKEGSHFLSGKLVGGVPRQKYNPDPSIKLGKLLSIRAWDLTYTGN